MFRNNLKEFLQAQDGFELLEPVDNTQAALHAIETLKPHLVLFFPSSGLQMPDVLQAVKGQGEGSRMLVIAGDTPLAEIVRFLADGVHGVFSKANELDQLPPVINRVLDGHTAVDQVYLREMVARTAALVRRPGPSVQITERESIVLAGICHGWTNKEIALKIGQISEQSIKAAVARLLRKYRVSDRAQLARAFAQQPVKSQGN